MTELLYIQDSYLFESTATILDTGNDGFGDYIILNRTIFYPQGGGQPSDIGTITSGANIFQVVKCRLNQDGVVYHYGTGNIPVGDAVILSIDAKKRVTNIRNHSAGHLLDVAMTELGYNSLSPTKGYHFADGAYVEYEGNFDEDKDQFIQKIESKMQELIHQDIPLCINYEKLGDLQAPTGKIPRYVYFQGYEGCGCGGTHVKKSGEIGGISLRKVKYKKGILKISYTIDS